MADSVPGWHRNNESEGDEEGDASLETTETFSCPNSLPESKVY